MENQTVTHITQNGKYKVQFERVGSSKGTIGYKIEANGDNLADVVQEAGELKRQAEAYAGLPIAEEKK